MSVPRTVLAHDFWAGAEAFCREQGHLSVQGCDYSMVSSKTEDFSSSPVASVGSGLRREVVLLDPKKSPLLQDKYVKLKGVLAEKAEKAGGPLEESEILQTINEYVRREVFSSPVELSDALIALHQSSGATPKVRVKGHSITCIPIDRFVEIGSGVCRHRALVTAYLIDRLTKEDEPLLAGGVRQIRSRVPGGAHTWCVYVNKDSRMLVDPSWKFFSSDIEKNRREVTTRYGSLAYDYMIENTQELKETLTPKPGFMIRELSYLGESSCRQKFFKRFGEYMKATGATQEKYDFISIFLKRAIAECDPPCKAMFTDYLARIEESIQKQFEDPTLAKYPEIVRAAKKYLLGFLRQETWVNAFEGGKLTQKPAHETNTYSTLSHLITCLEKGEWDRDAFDSLPTSIKNTLYGTLYRLDKKAGVATDSDFDYGKHAFLGEGQPSNDAHRIKALQLTIVDFCSALLKVGREEEAMFMLTRLSSKFRGELIYSKMWEVCGKPTGNMHFGAQAFHGEIAELQKSQLKEKRIAALEAVQQDLLAEK